MIELPAIEELDKVSGAHERNVPPLEPGIGRISSSYTQMEILTSIAMSLKRIADRMRLEGDYDGS